MTIKDVFVPYIAYLEKKGRASATIVEHKRFMYGALSHSIADKELSELKLTDAASVEEGGRMHGSYGPQRAIVTFRRLLKYLQDDGMKLPFDWRAIEVPKGPPQKEIEYLEKEELDIIRDSIDLNIKAGVGIRQRAILEVLVATGMRISELCSLNRLDINWEKKETKVISCKLPHKEKTKYLTDSSLMWLKKYLEARKDDNPWLFQSGRGRLIPQTSKNFFEQLTKKLQKEIGFRKRIYHHIFRKTYATHLIRNKVDIKTVQNLCGHESERTTLKFYTGVDKEFSQSEHARVITTL